MICEKCGRLLDDDENYCSKCGTKRKDETKEIYCPKCHGKIDENTIFCPNCGIKIVSSLDIKDKTKFIKGLVGIIISIIILISILMLIYVGNQEQGTDLLTKEQKYYSENGSDTEGDISAVNSGKYDSNASLPLDKVENGDVAVGTEVVKSDEIDSLKEDYNTNEKWSRTARRDGWITKQGDWIYYTYDSGDSNIIEKRNVASNDFSIIISTFPQDYHIKKLAVYGDYIVFQVDTSINRIKVDGSGLMGLISDIGYGNNFLVRDSLIYWVTTSNISAQSYSYSLMSTDIETGETVEVTSLADDYLLQDVKENYILFSSISGAELIVVDITTGDSAQYSALQYADYYYFNEDRNGFLYIWDTDSSHWGYEEAGEWLIQQDGVLTLYRDYNYEIDVEKGVDFDGTDAFYDITDSLIYSYEGGIYIYNIYTEELKSVITDKFSDTDAALFDDWLYYKSSGYLCRVNINSGEWEDLLAY